MAQLAPIEFHVCLLTDACQAMKEQVVSLTRTDFVGGLKVEGKANSSLKVPTA